MKNSLLLLIFLITINLASNLSFSINKYFYFLLLQVLLKYDDSKRIYYLRIVINIDIIENESDCNLVTDYVVFNLSKKEKD